MKKILLLMEKIKRYLLNNIKIWVLLLTALFLTIVIRFEYIAYYEYKGSQIELLRVKAAELTKQSNDLTVDIEEELKALASDNLIINLLKSSNSKDLKDLLAKKLGNLGHVRSFTIFDKNKTKISSVAKTSDDSEPLKGSYLRTREVERLFQLLESKKYDQVLLPTFYYFGSVANVDNVLKFSRITGQYIIDNEGNQVGTFILEVDIGHIVRNLFSQLSYDMNGYFVDANNTYFSSNPSDNDVCAYGLNCSRYFPVGGLSVDGLGHRYFNGNLIVKNVLELNEAYPETADPASYNHTCLILTYKKRVLSEKDMMFLSYQLSFSFWIVLFIILSIVLFCINHLYLYLIERFLKDDPSIKSDEGIKN